MQARDRQILEHVGRYRLTTRPALDKLFFPSSSGCGNVLARLLSNRMLRRRPGLPGRRSHYQLTEKSAAEVGVPVSRTVQSGPQALREALSILAYCVLEVRPASTTSRMRLEVAELAELTGARFGPGPSPHVLEVSEEHRIYRVSTPSPTTRSGSIVRGAATWLEKATATEALKSWVQAGKYAYLVLAEVQRVPDVARAVGRAGLDHCVQVRPIPSPSTGRGASNDDPVSQRSH